MSGICAGRVVVAIAMLLGFSRADPVRAADQRPMSDEVAERYMQLCASCHGRHLEGGQGPSLLSATLMQGSDEGSLKESISNGFPGKGMPAWSNTLSAAEVRGLVTYLRERRAAFVNGERAIYDRDNIEKTLPAGVQSSELHSFRVELVTRGLQAPHSFVFLSDTRMLVTDKHDSALRVIERGKLLSEPVKGTPEVHHAADGSGMLFGVRLHPDYARNGWIYLSYAQHCDTCTQTDPANGERAAITAVVRGHIRDGVWTDQQTIWQAPREFFAPPNYNYGGAMAFDAQGYLYFSIGVSDPAREQAQDLTQPRGKIHRVHDDGRIPRDNPFANRPDALPSIWTYGHRHPQGLAYDTHSGRLWSSEHGPRGGDELNLIRPGHNYGWPVITFGINYDGTPISAKSAQEGMDSPIVDWTPSIAVASIGFYEGRAFPRWRQNLFVTSLKQEELRRLELDGDRVTHQEVVLRDIGRLRDVTTGPDGYLYVLVEVRSAVPGQSCIVRLVPAKRGRVR